MWNVFGYTIACAVFGSLWPSSAAAGLFGSLLGDNDSNNNSPSIPLIVSLGIGSNRNEQNGQNNNYNQYPNNNNQYANSNDQYTNNNNNAYPTDNNNNNQYANSNNNGYANNNNVNRGLLSVFGGNENVNRPNTNNLNNPNPYPTTGHNNPNVNDIKNQMKDAEKLLERLKELNRLKEQQKLKEENKNSQGQKQPDTAIEDLEIDNRRVNIKDDGKKKAVLKSLTKKFYFMVKPVVPENEVTDQEQTVYYLD